MRKSIKHSGLERLVLPTCDWCNSTGIYSELHGDWHLAMECLYCDGTGQERVTCSVEDARRWQAQQRQGKSDE